MEAFYISAILIIIINIHTARAHISSSHYSSFGSLAVVIIIPISIALIIFVTLICYCKLKQTNRRRMGILPLSTQIALAQQENQYAPPPYHRVPPYGQPPPYEQPPPYSAASAPMKETLTS